MNDTNIDRPQQNHTITHSKGALMEIFTELATTKSKLKKEMLTKKYRKRVRKIFNKMGVK